MSSNSIQEGNSIVDYFLYLLSTFSVLLLSIPLALFLALVGIVKLLYPRRKESP